MIFVFRLTGCLSIVLASTFVGCYFSEKLKSRCSFLRELLDFFNNLETYLRFSCDDIFSVLEKSFTGKMLKTISIVAQYSEKEYWQTFMSNIPSHYGLNKEDLKLLSDFGCNLGVTDIEGQISNVELYKNLFTTQLQKAETECKEKSKLFKMLGFFAGSAVALMII